MTQPLDPVVKIDALELFAGFGDYYPEPYGEPCRGREWREMGNAVGLSQFGVNLVTLRPGAWSSQRHWHTNEDEFVFVLEGEVTLVTDTGERVLSAGMAAGFAAGTGDGHHLINRTERDARLIEVGTRARVAEGEYSDIDLKFVAYDGVDFRFFHKDGTPY